LGVLTHRIIAMLFGQTQQFRPGGVGTKSIGGAGALAVGVMVERGTRFVRNMILARLLAPESFGLIAIVMVSAMAFEAMTEVGVKQSVIQNSRGSEEKYLNVALWVQIVRGLGLFIIAMMVAPLIAHFYNNVELTNLIRVCFLSVFFRLLQSPKAYVFQKEFKFRWVVLLEQGSALLGTITTLVLSFLMRNVWALVIGYVAEGAILCLLSYILAPFRPRMGIDRQCFGELMAFGRGMFGLPILAMFSFQLDVLVLGKVVSSEQLGIYYLALTLVNLPMDVFSRIIGPVLLPAFAEGQADKEKVLRMVLKLSRAIAILFLPMLIVIAGCASPILLIVFGAKFTVAAVPLTILMTFAFIFGQTMVITQVYMGLGNPHLHRRFSIVRLAILVLLMYPCVLLFGPTGAASVVLLANLIALVCQVLWVRRLIDLKVSSYFRTYLPGLLLAIPSAVILGLLHAIHMNSTILLLAVGLGVLVMTYGSGFWVLTRQAEFPGAGKYAAESVP
jgi:lipopolysaccharide exporter